MKIKNKYGFPIFFSDEGGDESGGGDGGGETSSGTSGGSTQTQQTTQQVAQPPPAPGFDPSKFAKEFGTTFAETFQKSQPKAPPTEAELAQAKKDLNFMDFDDDFIKEFSNLETQKGAFGKLRDGLTKQMLTIVTQLLAQRDEQYTKQFDERFQPVQQMLTHREETEREGRFHSAFPELKNDKYKPLIGAVATELASQGKFAGKTEAEAFTILAQGVELVFQQNNPEFKLGANGSQSDRSSNSLGNNTSGSGAGGSSGAGQVKAPKSNVLSALGPVGKPKK